MATPTKLADTLDTIIAQMADRHGPEALDSLRADGPESPFCPTLAGGDFVDPFWVEAVVQRLRGAL